MLTCGGKVKIVVSPRSAAGSYVIVSQVHNGSSGGRQASCLEGEASGEIVGTFPTFLVWLSHTGRTAKWSPIADKIVLERIRRHMVKMIGRDGALPVVFHRPDLNHPSSAKGRHVPPPVLPQISLFPSSILTIRLHRRCLQSLIQ